VTRNFGSPGWPLPGLLLGAAMVAWASFGLLTE
jgi:hypothetical protein